MLNRKARSPGSHRRLQWHIPTTALAAAALFIALGGSAVAANGLIKTKHLATGAVTSNKIDNHTVKPKDLARKTRNWLQGADGATGATGPTGATGLTGARGATGSTGDTGPRGLPGADGTNGTDGTSGTNGTDGTDGIVAPLSATAGSTVLPPTGPPVVIVELAVPAGSYVVLAKTQLWHSGAGDAIECALKADATTLDQVAMKTLPALAEIPVSLHAVTATSATGQQLSVECDMRTADGTADHSSLIAIPIG